MEALLTLRSIELLLSVFLFVQCLEFLKSHSLNQVKRIWAVDVVMLEHKNSALQWTQVLMTDAGWRFLLWSRLALSGFLFIGAAGPWSLLALLLNTFFMLFRFRGNFNGGSDFMSTLLLIGVFLARSLPSAFQKWVILYLGIQTVFSYVLAGLVKLKEPEWRSGEALRSFLHTQSYETPKIVMEWTSGAVVARALSVLIFVFELGAPVVFFGRSYALAFCMAGLFFHGVVFKLFGLNRFFWAWVASYPTLFYLSGVFQR